VYDQFGLLHQGTYMAHCVYSSEEEQLLLKERQVGVVHCASSNFNLRSGVMPVRAFLAKDIKVGLGTDVAGGHSHSMLDAIKQSIVASTVVHLQQQQQQEQQAAVVEPLSYKEAFYLATMGSACVLNMQGIIGNFLIGKQLDCLVVDAQAPGGPLDVYEGGYSKRATQTHSSAFSVYSSRIKKHTYTYKCTYTYECTHKTGESSEERFSKFLFNGDDRNISRVFVDGKQVK